MTAPERRGPERPGPDYPPEWDNEPAEDLRDLESERAQIRQGICPRSGARITPNGILRPACSFCDCGEDE